MTDSLALPKPKVRRRKIDAAMRKRIEAAVQAMIDTLDALDASTEELEEDEGDDDPDAEPSLGATEDPCQDRAWTDAYHKLPDGELDLGAPGCWGTENENQVFHATRRYKAERLARTASGMKVTPWAKWIEAYKSEMVRAAAQAVRA